MVAEEERRAISERTKAALAAGRRLQGNSPLSPDGGSSPNSRCPRLWHPGRRPCPRPRVRCRRAETGSPLLPSRAHHPRRLPWRQLTTPLCGKIGSREIRRANGISPVPQPSISKASRRISVTTLARLAVQGTHGFEQLPDRHLPAGLLRLPGCPAGAHRPAQCAIGHNPAGCPAGSEYRRGRLPATGP